MVHSTGAWSLQSLQQYLPHPHHGFLASSQQIALTFLFEDDDPQLFLPNSTSCSAQAFDRAIKLYFSPERLSSRAMIILAFSRDFVAFSGPCSIVRDRDRARCNDEYNHHTIKVELLHFPKRASTHVHSLTRTKFGVLIPSAPLRHPSSI